MTKIEIKSAYINALNEMAFMIHEAQYDSSRWDNEEFIKVVNYFINFNDLNSTFRELEDWGEIKTILGDTFKYEYNSKKIINGITVYP